MAPHFHLRARGSGCANWPSQSGAASRGRDSEMRNRVRSDAKGGKPYLLSKTHVKLRERKLSLPFLPGLVSPQGLEP
jgi:hypothetical protein